MTLCPVVEPALKFVDCPHENGTGTHKMAYWEWFDGNNSNSAATLKTIVCVHGLTRNGRDFDVVASRLFYEGLRSKNISISKINKFFFKKI